MLCIFLVSIATRTNQKRVRMATVRGGHHLPLPPPPHYSHMDPFLGPYELH